MGQVLCEDCLDTGWLHDREGRYVCSCVAETEPYILLKAENERLRETNEAIKRTTKQWRIDAERYRLLVKLIEDDTGEATLRLWRGDENGDWHHPANKAEIDAAIDTAREGE